MLKNYFLIVWINIIPNKVNSIINTFGLALKPDHQRQDSNLEIQIKDVGINSLMRE